MIHESESTVFTSIVDKPFPLVSAEVKEVFDMYEPYIPYKEIILLDQKFQRMEVYYLPILEEVDCLHEKSEYNLDRSLIKKGIIDYKISYHLCRRRAPFYRAAHTKMCDIALLPSTDRFRHTRLFSCVPVRRDHNAGHIRTAP